jgi:phytoene synthase
MADVVATSTEPALGAIRLAWWRERLVELDQAPASPEPRLHGVTEHLLGRGVTGQELSELEACWRPLLEPFPWGKSVTDGLRQRGRILFGIGARILGWNPDDTKAAGALWSLVDGARNCSDFYSRTFLLDEARKAIAKLPRNKPPRAVRGMTVLAALAAHDVLRNRPLDLGGGMGRLAVAFLHQLRGDLPRG